MTADADLWSRLAGLRGETLQTERGARFTVNEVYETYLSITVKSSGLSRRIERTSLERAAELKLPDRPLRPSLVRASGVAPESPEYVAALINTVS